MEEILHHLGWLKPYKSWDVYHRFQLVQDFFDLLYGQPPGYPYPAADHRLLRIIALHLPLRPLRGVLGEGWHGTWLLDWRLVNGSFLRGYP